MTSQKIREKLLSLREPKYAEFSSSLMPTVDKNTVIGVRIPTLRKYAKQLMRDRGQGEFLSELPHKYFEENNLHAFMIEQIKDFDACVDETERFLPFVDNWATCDSMRPKCFGENREELITYIEKWLLSEHTYTVRFAIQLLMLYYLDEEHIESSLERVSKVKSDEYYVNMMIAWFFATALAKDLIRTLPYIEGRCLSPWVHNKAIGKACESYRITDEQKKYLKTLKI